MKPSGSLLYLLVHDLMMADTALPDETMGIRATFLLAQYLGRSVGSATLVTMTCAPCLHCRFHISAGIAAVPHDADSYETLALCLLIFLDGSLYLSFQNGQVGLFSVLLIAFASEAYLRGSDETETSLSCHSRRQRAGCYAHAHACLHYGNRQLMTAQLQRSSLYPSFLLYAPVLCIIRNLFILSIDDMNLESSSSGTWASASLIMVS